MVVQSISLIHPHPQQKLRNVGGSSESYNKGRVKVTYLDEDEAEDLPFGKLRSRSSSKFNGNGMEKREKVDDLFGCMKPLLGFARVIGLVPLAGIFGGLEKVQFRFDFFNY